MGTQRRKEKHEDAAITPAMRERAWEKYFSEYAKLESIAPARPSHGLEALRRAERGLRIMGKVSAGMRHLSLHSVSEYTRLFAVGMAAFYGIGFAARRILGANELSNSQKTKFGYATEGTALAASYYVPLWVERIDAKTRNMARDAMSEVNAWLGRGTASDGQVTKLFWAAAIVVREATDCLRPLLSGTLNSGIFDLAAMQRSAIVTSQCLEGVAACSTIIALAAQLRTPVSQEHALDMWMRGELLQTHYDRIGKAALSTLKKYKACLASVVGTRFPTESSAVKSCESSHSIVGSICRDLYTAHVESDKDSKDDAASFEAWHGATDSRATFHSEEVRTWRECRNHIRERTHNTAKTRASPARGR